MSMKIADVFKRGSKKEPKESSLKVYTRAINKYMMNNVPMTEPDDLEKALTFEWVFDAEKVVANIENDEISSINSKRTLLSYLKIFMRGLSNQADKLPEFDVYDKAEKKYEDMMKAEREKNRKEKGIPTTNKQAENLVDLKDIEASMIVLKNEIKQIDKLKQFNSEEQKKYTLYLLLNTHFRFPFRNELHNLIFVKGKKEFDEKYDKDETNNYLLKTGKKLEFIRNVYKTAGSKKSGGRKVDDLPAELTKLYNKYIKHFAIKSGEDMFPQIKNSVDYTRLLTNHFVASTNKNISSTLLMKIINELEEDHKKLIPFLKALSLKRGTSVDNIIEYYM